MDRVGLRGVVVRDGRFALQLATPDRGIRLVPKEGTVFCVRLAASATAAAPDSDSGAGSGSAEFVFEVLGDQLRVRAADRANRKFKLHFLDNL